MCLRQPKRRRGHRTGAELPPFSRGPLLREVRARLLSECRPTVLRSPRNKTSGELPSRFGCAGNQSGQSPHPPATVQNRIGRAAGPQAAVIVGNRRSWLNVRARRPFSHSSRAPGLQANRQFLRRTRRSNLLKNSTTGKHCQAAALSEKRSPARPLVYCTTALERLGVPEFLRAFRASPGLGRPWFCPSSESNFGEKAPKPRKSAWNRKGLWSDIFTALLLQPVVSA